LKIAVISDIHSNLEALTAVLDDIQEQGAEQIVCLGDVVGYGPNPRECLDLIMQEAAVCILGNHDQGAMWDPEGFHASAERAIFWTREQLEDYTMPNAEARWEFLNECPRRHEDGDLMFVHGSPRNPLNEYVFPENIYDPQKMERLFQLIKKCCFQGHTHVPGVFTQKEFFSPSDLDSEYRITDQKVMVNVGSVGQPRDLDPRSCYVIVNDGLIQYRRVEYPLQETAAKIERIAALDDHFGNRLRDGR
jgi:predicted phosphodiesterase